MAKPCIQPERVRLRNRLYKPTVAERGAVMRDVIAVILSRSSRAVEGRHRHKWMRRSADWSVSFMDKFKATNSGSFKVNASFCDRYF